MRANRICIGFLDLEMEVRGTEASRFNHLAFRNGMRDPEDIENVLWVIMDLVDTESMFHRTGYV